MPPFIPGLIRITTPADQITAVIQEPVEIRAKFRKILQVFFFQDIDSE
jgi:hypothetical protein